MPGPWWERRISKSNLPRQIFIYQMSSPHSSLTALGGSAGRGRPSHRLNITQRSREQKRQRARNAFPQENVKCDCTAGVEGQGSGMRIKPMHWKVWQNVSNKAYKNTHILINRHRYCRHYTTIHHTVQNTPDNRYILCRTIWCILVFSVKQSIYAHVVRRQTGQ